MTFFGIFDIRWPFMTSWHLSSVSWIQERHYDIPFTHFQSLLKFHLFSEFLTSGDLCWPRFILKSLRQERQFDIYFIIFYQSSKFDLFSKFLTSGDLCWPRDPFFWKADVKGVILIYNLPTFDDFWNLTLNDPKFVIWPQTKIFSSGNHNQVLLIILSYRSRKLVESVIFN